MISEKEAKSIATAVFIEKYTREYLLTVVDRIAMWWSKSKGIFDMNFGIFPETKSDGCTHTRKNFSNFKSSMMHFTDKNFTWHIEESGHFCGWLSYKDLYELFSEDTE